MWVTTPFPLSRNASMVPHTPDGSYKDIILNISCQGRGGLAMPGFPGKEEARTGNLGVGNTLLVVALLAAGLMGVTGADGILPAQAKGVSRSVGLMTGEAEDLVVGGNGTRFGKVRCSLHQEGEPADAESVGAVDPVIRIGIGA